MRLDAVSVEVVRALQEAGIDVVLLKGVSLARWLYPEGGRFWTDVDLWADPDRRTESDVVLRELGFVPTPPLPDDYETTYRRGDVVIDLHHSLPRVPIPAAQAWRAIAPHRTTMPLLDLDLPVLDEVGLTYHAAHHAAQHGRTGGSPRPHDAAPNENAGHVQEDLRRALAIATPAQWQGAAALATRLGTAPLLAAVLDLTPEGRALATGLALPAPDAASRLSATAADRDDHRAHALAWALQAGRRRERAGRLVRLLLPTPAWMREVHLGRDVGTPALLVAYLRRLGGIAARTPTVLRRWWRARG